MMCKVNELFSASEITQVSKELKFVIYNSCVKPTDFFYSVLKCFKDKSFTLNKVAENLATTESKSIDTKNVSQKLNNGFVETGKHFLKKVLDENIKKNTCIEVKKFGKVLVNDSTCVALPEGLAEFFPGSHSKTGKAATLRIQTTMDIKSESSVSFSVSNFRDNDQSHADDILDVIAAGDISLRDLGYFKIDTLAAIAEKGAFFLTRYKQGVSLFESEKATKKLDLHKILQQAKAQGKAYFEQTLFIGKDKKLKVRLVAIRLPDEQANEKKRKAKKDRNLKAKHSQEYFDMLDWNIFITNLPEEEYDAKEICKLYRLRWSIEMVFKCWKNVFQLDEYFKNKPSLKNPNYVYSVVYFFLLYITAYVLPSFSYWRQLLLEKKGKHLSLMKFAKFITTEAADILLVQKSKKQTQHTLKFLGQHCAYEKRRNRLNFYEQLEDLWPDVFGL